MKLEFCGKFFSLEFFQLTSCAPKEGVSERTVPLSQELVDNTLNFVCLKWEELSPGKGWTVQLEMTFYKELHSFVNMPCGKKMKYHLFPSLKRTISAYVLD